MAKEQKKDEKAEELNTQDSSAPGTDLATQQQGGALQVVEDYGDDAGAGLENVGVDEYKIPFLRILQALSPACKPVEAGGMEGAKPGLIMNTATGEIYDGKEGLDFVPAVRDHNFVEFVPRDAGGGLVGIHAVDDPKVLQLRAEQGKFGKLKTNDDTEISESFYLYGLVIPAGRSPFRAIVGFTSSQIKKYQEFMGRVMGIEYTIDTPNGKKAIKPPMWAHRWHLGTVFEKGKKGEFYNWKLSLTGRDEKGMESSLKSIIPMKDPLYIAAKEFADMVKGGKAKVDYNQAAGGDDEGDNAQPPDNSGSGPASADDEIPF